MRAMRIEEFDYELPSELIAQAPAAERGASRLLHLDGRSGVLVDGRFSDLPSFLGAGDLLVFNDTQVIKARLQGMRESGGRIEVLVERVLPPRRALAMLRASNTPRPGARLGFGGGGGATVVERRDEFFLLEFDDEVAQVLDRCGQLPLPPYIERPATDQDAARYQTVYARVPGAVAAPTAGLHFDAAMIERLARMGVQTASVTLHVGAGTFQPVRVDKIEDHVMHSERYEIPEATAAAIAEARARGGTITAVGTTSLRALESAAARGAVAAGSGETRLFIRPGYRFRVVDRLLTNFHLPCSTLLMLVSSFAGLENVRAAYAHAIRERYRFFSYGDAMLVERAPQP
ncbi:MAG TPA: tRNA preQ1(34) S-adenosylmethionine ribosyltransferase-isomerase QueA [Burkholderiales bacterium]|nr:tRNA preQ1(34) S-adenosylmethionine ribosyltransferase-isomerase QueA [Burkholderiales bacterium]